MKILSHIVGTVILFILLLTMAETVAWYLPLSVPYIVSILALAMVSSFYVYEVINKWGE